MLHKIIIIQNLDTQEYFFTKDYCQDTTEDWVPLSATLPLHITPRESLPTGVVETLEEYIDIFLKGATRIPNPIQENEPDYSRTTKGSS